MTILRHNRNPLRTAGRKLLWLPNPSEQLGYGLLYNWFAATDARGIAPAGWSVPAQSQVLTLRNYLDPINGGDDNLNDAGGKMSLAGLPFWEYDDELSTNTCKFNLSGNGQRTFWEGDSTYNGLLMSATGWCTEEYPPWDPYGGKVFGRNLSSSALLTLNYLNDKKNGNGIRLVNDSTDLSNGQTGTMTDFDGNVYPTICIGTQEWMAANLKVKHYNNGDAIPNVTDNGDWAALTDGAWCVYDNNPLNE